jgi:peroxiredoxin Q/BCP
MLQTGQAAPDFHLQDQNGLFHSLQEFKGKKLALFFYPKDNTPGCTEQACNMRDNIDLLTKHGISVLGVSIDSVRKHKNFETKFSLPFPLLADVNKDLVNAYEVWGEKTFWGRKYMGTFRVTFLIDENGKIAHIIEKVDTTNHAAQILDFWK